MHETALASPETVDLGGRVVVPGFSDAHVHFPTWALAQTEVTSTAALARRGPRARARVGAAGGRPLAPRLRLAQRRLARRPRADRAHDLDAVTGDVPAALIAKDYHSLWLNSAALARAGGDLEVAGGVVERDGAGEPTGILREEAAWRSRRAT